jgi:hypothetical protein
MSRLFTAHLPERADPARAILIDDRWRWAAFVFPVLWSLWGGRWILALGLLAGGGGSVALLSAGQPVAAVALDLAVRLAVGFEGGALARLDLSMRGWREHGAVDADDAEEAELRWCARAAADAAEVASARVAQWAGPWGATA